MEKRRYSGRYLMLLGAAGLLAWAGYEFWVRMEVTWGFLKGIYNMCVAKGFSFIEALGYFDPKIFTLTGYLLGCAIFALLAIAFRNRARAGYWLILLDVALIVLGGPVLGLFGLSIAHWMQSLKLIPLLLILAGCVINLCQFYVKRRRRRQKRRRWEDDEAYDDRPSNRDMAQQVKRRRSERRYPEAG